MFVPSRFQFQIVLWINPCFYSDAIKVLLISGDFPYSKIYFEIRNRMSVAGERVAAE